jgi:hypothetical protein
MTERKKSDLKSQIESQLADNTDGGITAQVIRDNMVDIVDSITPIMASGTDNYFRNNVDFRDSSVTTSNTAIGSMYGQWDANAVSEVRFATGNDANTYKDHGAIEFCTSAGIIASGTSELSKRMVIDNHGTVTIFGSGILHNTDTGGPTVHIKSIYGSGLGLLFEGSDRDMGIPTGKNFQLGHWTTGQVFTPRLTVSSRGYLGIGKEHPAEPIHVAHSGYSLRLDTQTSSPNKAGITLNKYKSTSTYGYNDLLLGFGMGVHTAASGHGYFYIGANNSRDFIVKTTEAAMVISSGGYMGIGNVGPNEKLVVGDDLGKITSSGNALVIGTTHGPSHLIIGSGVGNANRANYSSFKWENDNNRLVVETRSNFKKMQNQLVLDSTNGNVGIGSSGLYPKAVKTPTYWKPNYKLHVMGSGSSVDLAIENAANSSTAIYIGKETNASGVTNAGHWGCIGYHSTNNVLKINNSGSILPSQFVVDAIGNVGINTSSPYDDMSIGTNRLHVHGENSAILIGDPLGGNYSALRLLGSRKSATSANDTAFIQAGTTAADTDAKLRITRFDTEATNLYKFDIYADTTTYHGSGLFNGVVMLNGKNISLKDGWLSNDGSDEGLQINNDGNVGLGQLSNISYQLELKTNSAAKPTSTLWTATSDERVKKNIESIDSENALGRIMNLRPVSFNFIPEYCGCHELEEDLTHYNFIAQEVADVFPECVVEVGQDLIDHHTGELVVENMKGLDAHSINVHMLSAIQELKIQLDAAKDRISQLES